MTTGNPVIIGVNPKVDPKTGKTYAGHYVTATGKTTYNGQDTYAINDPVNGQTTLAKQWSNAYYSILLLSGTSADQRNLRISAHSPVELLLTDPLGRKVGYDPNTDTVYDEIPGASYFIQSIVADDGTDNTLPVSKVIIVNIPLDGNYDLQILGTDIGEYEVDIIATDWLARTSSLTHIGTAENGSGESQQVEYSSYTGVNTDFIYLPVLQR